MTVATDPTPRKDSNPLRKYYGSIIVAGVVSAVVTILIRVFSALIIENERYLTEIIAKITFQILISLMVLIGTFIVLRLQIHFSEESNLRSRLQNSVYNYNRFFSGFDEAYCHSPLDQLREVIASGKILQEARQEHILRLQKLKKEGLCLLIIVITVSVLSYPFLFLEFLNCNVTRNGFFAYLGLNFCIFVTTICVIMSFLAIKFIWDAIKD